MIGKHLKIIHCAASAGLIKEFIFSVLQILKPADKKLYPYGGGGGGVGLGRPVTPPRNAAKAGKAKK